MSEWCITLAKCGFLPKNDNLLNTVQKIVANDGRKTSFTNGRPGKKWLSGFFKRHLKLFQRTLEGISKGRAVVTKECIRKWFSDFLTFMQKITQIKS